MKPHQARRARLRCQNLAELSAETWLMRRFSHAEKPVRVADQAIPEHRLFL